MQIIHINTYDVEGGAARMALGLANRQCHEGHNAHMIVGRKSLKDNISSRFDSLPNESIRPFCEASKLSYFHFQGSHKLSGDSRVKNADILHVHNIHFDYFNPFSLSFLSHCKPTIWTFHDLFPVTGFCMHPGKCPGWYNGCFPCNRKNLNDPHNPDQIRSGKTSSKQNQARPDQNNTGHTKREENSQSHTPTGESSPGPALCVQWKKLIYNHCHMTCVCPSEWMCRQVQKSCFSGIKVNVVHNGVDTSVFKPMDKRKAKQALGLSPETKVLGAVAVHGALDNPLKGGIHLQQLLERLCPHYFKHNQADLVFLNIGSDKPDPSPFIRNIPYIENQQELARTYAAMDIMVHAAAAESFCLVAVEAMACGIRL